MTGRTIQEDPDFTRAVAAHRAGRLAEAEGLYLSALARGPRNTGALANLGALYRALRRFGEAEKCYERALEIEPKSLQVLGNYANLLKLSNREDSAAALLERAIPLDPRNADFRASLALCRIGVGRFREGLEVAEQAITIDGNCAEAHCARGQALAQLGDAATAQSSFRRALAVVPTAPVYVTNLANSLVGSGDFAEAIQVCRDGLRAMPGNAELMARCSESIGFAGDLEEAIRIAREGVELEPKNSDINWMLALALLRAGQLGEGLDRHDWRWRLPGFPSPSRRFRQPGWAGGDFRGKHLYIWGEQGVGDEIIHMSVLPDLLAAGARVTLEVDPRLEPLVRRAMPEIELARRSSERPFPTVDRPDMDAQLPLGSLLRFFRRSMDGFPTAKPYLAADAERVAMLRSRYRALGDGPIVGLGWSSTNAKIGSFKTLGLKEYASILAARPAVYINLQYGDTAAEVAAFEQETGIRIHSDPEIDALKDLDGFAAQAAAVDLVLSTSNSGVHLAGAIGAKVWTILPSRQGALWYWFTDGEATPWYSDMRVFRAASYGDWPIVKARLTDEFLILDTGCG